MLPLGVFPYSPGSLVDSMSEQPCTPHLLNQHLRPVTTDPTGARWGACDPHCADKQGIDFQVSTAQTSCDFHYLPLHTNKNALLKVPDRILVTYF